MKRVILKLSGEALFDNEKNTYDDKLLRQIASNIKMLLEKKMEIGIVIGGGNYWRGRSDNQIDRTKSDQIGMLATVMNCIYVSEIFRLMGLKTAIMTPYSYGPITEVFTKDNADNYLTEGKIVFFAGGTGHPFFSTDTLIALRAAELSVDAILLAKNVDGVYDSDPLKNPNAKRYDKLSITQMVDDKLAVIDMTASVMCMENKIGLRVFSLREKDSIINAFNDDFNGTDVYID